VSADVTPKSLLQAGRDGLTSAGARDVAAPWEELALWAASMGRYRWDLRRDVIEVGERAAVILGGNPGTHKAEGGERLMRAVHPEDRDWARRTLLGAIATGQPFNVEHRSVRTDQGRVVWLMSAGAPVRDASGEVVQVLGVVKDITARKFADTQREALTAELDHRIKNILASVQSMALQSARKASSLDVFLKTFSGRLKAMAAAHTLLTATRWRGASIHHLVAAELGGLAPGQTRWEGPELTLTPRGAQALALALHELAANAVKFGALSTDVGRVDVRWFKNERGGFNLEWAESGGPLTRPPAREGFGSVLLNKVTGRELGGRATLEFPATGARALIVSDAETVIPAPPAPPTALPAADLKVQQGASAGVDIQDHATKIAGLRVLIVEDALLLSLELEAGLEEAGAKVIGQAANVEEAMALLHTPMDAAVLDANLNGRSVTPVAQALADRGVPFIFATGHGDDHWAPQGFSAPFIRKPYDVTQVAAALAEVTGRA